MILIYHRPRPSTFDWIDGEYRSPPISRDMSLNRKISTAWAVSPIMQESLSKTCQRCIAEVPSCARLLSSTVPLRAFSSFSSAAIASVVCLSVCSVVLAPSSPFSSRLCPAILFRASSMPKRAARRMTLCGGGAGKRGWDLHHSEHQEETQKGADPGLVCCGGVGRRSSEWAFPLP